jgi:hypothetical protein
MSSHHDHHDSHVNENKPVSFRTPLILALVTVLLILLAVSTCDGHHEKSACDCSEPCTAECMAECEAKSHETNGASAHHESDTHEEHSTTTSAVVDTTVLSTTIDTTVSHH